MLRSKPTRPDSNWQKLVHDDEAKRPRVDLIVDTVKRQYSVPDLLCLAQSLKARKSVVVGNTITWNWEKRTDWFFQSGLIEEDRYAATRRCPACLEPRTIEGHDPCLGTLPGVKFACCGHGVHRGYIFFENGLIIRGKFNVVERKQGDDSCTVVKLSEDYD